MICPVCKGKGSYRAPYYSDFGPTMREVPCICTERKASLVGLIAVLVFLLLVMARICWGLP